MGKISIKKMVLGDVSTNCYIVSNQETKEAVIIDPSDNADRIRDYIVQDNLNLKAILLTHGHFDHIYATRDLVRMFQVPVYCHELEQEILHDPMLNLSAVMGRHGDIAIEASHLVKDNETIELIGETIQVLYTPGHTKGGVCYYFINQQCIFVGDTIFLESVGRTDFPTGNAITLIRSIQDKLYSLPLDIKLYPGHGPATSIGYEKENNPYTSEGAFWDER